MADDGLQLERTNRFWPFLISLSLLFVAGPLATRLDVGNLYRLAFMIVLVNGAYLVGNTRRHMIIALFLAAPAFLLQGVAIAVQNTALGVVATAATLACLGYVTTLSFARVLEPGDVSSDRLIGAACVYLLLGVIWSLVYSIQALFDPAAFHGFGDSPGGNGLFLYFSFVTLTTLGFGDISPLSAEARTGVWMEAVVGQLYLAILVARLVGIPSGVWQAKKSTEE